MISEEKKQVLDLFAQGRRHYKMMDFVQAQACFLKALTLDPADKPSEIYEKRCKELIANPPPEDWDGVFVMKTK